MWPQETASILAVPLGSLGAYSRERGYLRGRLLHADDTFFCIYNRMNILLTFTGFNDPYSLGLVGQDEVPGPIPSLISSRSIT